MNPSAAPPTMASTAANFTISLTCARILGAGWQGPQLLLELLLEVGRLPVHPLREHGGHAALAVDQIGLRVAQGAVARVHDRRKRVPEDGELRVDARRERADGRHA